MYTVCDFQCTLIRWFYGYQSVNLMAFIDSTEWTLHAVKTPCKTLIAEWSFPIGSFNWDRLEKLAFNFSVKNSLFDLQIYKERRIHGL